MTTSFLLDNRAVLTVTGPDAASFLNGLLTCAVTDMETGARRTGALLTPQGKILSDMILERTEDGFLLDCDAAADPGLIKRLAMFRLRAAVEIASREDLGVVAFEGEADPRGGGMPLRSIVSRAGRPTGDMAVYHRARIAAGIAEQGADFGPDEVFPADVNLDLIGAVDFKKGCFVGQEVVSRMKRRGSARRRTLQMQIPGPLATPCPVVNTQGAEIGQATSHAGDLALARLRIDRLNDTILRVDSRDARIVEPDWLAGELAAMAAAQATRA